MGGQELATVACGVARFVAEQGYDALLVSHSSHENQSPGTVVNANEVRDVGFRRGYYNAAQVDDLLGRLAMELDAGRPVRPLIANAAFRSGGLRPRGYDIESVDWFLDQLRSGEDRCDRAGTGADPWRGLAVAN